MKVSMLNFWVFHSFWKNFTPILSPRWNLSLFKKKSSYRYTHTHTYRVTDTNTQKHSHTDNRHRDKHTFIRICLGNDAPGAPMCHRALRKGKIDAPKKIDVFKRLCTQSSWRALHPTQEMTQVLATRQTFSSFRRRFPPIHLSTRMPPTVNSSHLARIQSMFISMWLAYFFFRFSFHCYPHVNEIHLISDRSMMISSP